MSPKGKADKRIQALCQALSGPGYRVVAPEIESIRKLRDLSVPNRQDLTLLIGIANDRSMSPSGQIGVFAPHFPLAGFVWLQPVSRASGSE